MNIVDDDDGGDKCIYYVSILQSLSIDSSHRHDANHSSASSDV